MKKTYIILLSVLTVITYITISSFKTSGGHPSSTGAPGELTCANATTGCHSSASVTNDNTNIVNTLLFSSADSSYVPNQTYTITLKAKKTGISKFGFEIVALRNSNNANTGTWIITDATRTHTLTGTGANVSRRYVTHSTPGTPQVSSGLGEWSFNWRAPSTNVGDITFYYATNCTNNNGQNTGDALYLSSFQIHPFSGTSITEWVDESDLQVIVDASSKELLLNYTLKKECELSVNLFDAQGKMIHTVERENKSAGKNTDRINLGHDINSGMYLVNLNIDNQTLTRKFMVQ